MNCTRKYTIFQLNFEDMSRALSSHNDHIHEMGSARRGIPEPEATHSISRPACGKHVGEKRVKQVPDSSISAGCIMIGLAVICLRLALLVAVSLACCCYSSTAT